MVRGGGVCQFPATGGEWGWGKRPRCMPEARALILGDGEGENSPKNTLHGGRWAAGEARQQSTGGAVEGGICRAREEQCVDVKLIDVESGLDGGWSELSAMGARGGESGRCRSASNPPRGAVALPASASLFDGDSWPHKGGLVTQGGSSPGTAAVERRRVWQQAERKQGRDDDGAKHDGSGFSFAVKCGGDKGGRWWRTRDCRPVRTAATSRQTMGGAAATAWRAGEAWPPGWALGRFDVGLGRTVKGGGPFNHFPKFQSFSNIQTLSNL
jgi:hypothetical protein